MGKKQINTIQVLNNKEIQALSDLIEKVTFNRSAHLHYHGHVPLAGHLFLEGEIVLSSKTTDSIRPQVGSVIGALELINNEPLKISVQIGPQSEVGILDRSTIHEIMNHPDPTIRDIIYKILCK